MQSLTNGFIGKRLSGRHSRARCAWMFAFLPLLFTRLAPAQTVTATVPTGEGPGCVVVNAVTNKTYVANYSGNSVTMIDGATNKTTDIAVGSQPDRMAVNPLTNKVYVANYGSANVTVIDGATNSSATVAVGSYPFGVAVNPVTNKVYVANSGSNNVTVIDGATNNTTAVATGIQPESVSVNPVTNKVYVANYGSASVTVIDGATNSSATVAVDSYPFGVAVNPVTNKVYVANSGSNNVTVIDGATNSTATVAVGSYPFSVAVNPVTNRVYVANAFSNNVTVIDGATNSTATVAAGSYPYSVAVNPVTNKIYVANYLGNVTAIDGATNTTATVPVGSYPFSVICVAVNPVTNKIYATNSGGNNVAVVDGATNNTATVATGPEPSSVAVNPVTNKIYVANYVGANVTVIDGATNSTTTVAAGTGPISVAVNPVTNKIYVANAISNDVTVIDGATNNATTVANVSEPYSVVVNPVTNKIYVVSNEITKCTVIDGETNTLSTVAVGFGSLSAAVNPVTNKIYVANDLDASVTVIDGATNATTTVNTGGPARFVAVNPVTNKIYVANGWGEGDYVTVIDGATNGTTNIASGGGPASVAVNPITNKIYVANSNSNNVTVIDGATNTTTTLAAGTSPISVAVNAVTNKIYVVSEYSNNVTIIDGASNTTTTVAAGTDPISVAVNPITNQVYVANYQSSNATVITETNTQAVPLTTTISPLTNNQSTSAVPAFTFSAASATVTQPDALFYQFDTWQSPWIATSGTNPTFTGSPSTLQPGFHILYAYATDGQEATSTQGSPQIGNIQAYGFLVFPSTPTGISANAGTTPQSTIVNSPFANNLAVTVTDASNNPMAGVAVTFTAPSTGASGTFSNGTNTIVVPTGTSGVAIAPFTANANNGVYSVTASAGNAVTSFLLTNSPLNVPTGPAISNIQAITVGGNSALITWTTDQPSTSQVNYGYTTSYGSSSSLDNSLVTSHAITLSNLSPNALYNFDVVSTNSTNGTTTSNNVTFTASPYVGYVEFWGITADGVTISWSTDAPANTFVAYGATTALGQLSPVQPALTNSHGVVLTGLKAGTTYYFRAESITAGGSTGASTLYSFTTTGTPSSPAPVVSNVSVINISTTSATVTWTTDQASTTQVNYGTSAAYGSSSPLDSSLVTSHSVTLTGLFPGTPYDFDLISANASGTAGISSNYTFQTAAYSLEPLIGNIQVTVTSTTATITWITDQYANSAVNYGSTSTTPDSNYGTNHSVTITGLTPGTTYDFSVVSSNASGQTRTSPTSTFTTTAANATAPFVGYVAFWGVNNSGVTISWSTDMPANTEVAYGTTAALGQFTPAQGALTNSHGVVLTGLASGTTYYFVAQSTAANGATGYSTTYSFTTTGSPSAPAPVISNIQTTVTTTTATITWTTDEAASSQVNYGATTTYSASSTLNATLTTSHSVTLTNLMPGTTYDFDVVSSNVNSLSSTSGNSTFQTTGTAPGPVITGVAASSITSGTALITWTTDQASTSVVNYGASTTSDATLVTSHSTTLSGLTPNTSYTFSVTSVNSSGVSSTSSAYTFTTSTPSAAAPVISYVAYWGITSSAITISWSTNVPSNTSVAYGTTSALTSVTPVQTALTSSHGVILTGLQPSTTYYFQAQSADVNGNTGYSATIYTFTTLAGPPSASNVIVTPATGNSATISWTTSVPTYSYVHYGPSAGNYIRYSVQTSLTTAPTCTLGYVPSGTIHYQLVSTDANGNQAVSPDATFVEP